MRRYEMIIQLCSDEVLEKSVRFTNMCVFDGLNMCDCQSGDGEGCGMGCGDGWVCGNGLGLRLRLRYRKMNKIQICSDDVLEKAVRITEGGACEWGMGWGEGEGWAGCDGDGDGGGMGRPEQKETKAGMALANE